MVAISFYARGDGSSANNASLNVDNPSQQPTTLITFESTTGGDIILESNGGAEDPDTTVTIDGVSYNFIVEQTGDLPLNHSKVPDELEGSQITVISVVIDGSYERFFFVTDGSGTQALMDQFGNGAIALDNTDTSPPDVYICFCAGTEIQTPFGPKKIETLQAGDLVLSADGKAMPILWIGQSPATQKAMRDDPTRRPVCIPANAIEPGVPGADLYLSAQHRVVLNSSMAQLLFGEPEVFAAAKHLVGTVARWVTPGSEVVYYHMLLERHEVVLSNGMPTESFQPALRSFNGISDEMRRSLRAAVPADMLHRFFKRPDAMISLKRTEAELLLTEMFKEGSTTPVIDLAA